jgi:hypothetical protein
MRTSILSFCCLSVIIFLSTCRQNEVQHKIYLEADSLLRITLDLQSSISSPGIQRLHDFEIEISKDLVTLSDIPEEDTSMVKYLELYNGLGNCKRACNQFHEEAFLLENSLLEIIDQVQGKKPDRHKLRKRLQFEKHNLLDLSTRIDSSLDLALQQAETFYALKPEINKIKEQFVRGQDPQQ